MPISRLRLAAADQPWYDRPMKAIMAEVDCYGLRRLLPADGDPKDVLDRCAKARPARPTTFIWALLPNEADAADVRADVAAGRHGDACGLLLNRAVELVALGSVVPETTRNGLRSPLASNTAPTCK